MRMDPAEYQALCKTAGFATRAERNNIEEGLHKACIEWANLHERAHPMLEWMIHVPNGGKRSKSEGGKLKAMGVKAGVPDLMLPFPSPKGTYTGLAIELKSPKGEPTDSQTRWLRNCKAAGYLVAICRTFEEFETVALRFLKG